MIKRLLIDKDFLFRNLIFKYFFNCFVIYLLIFFSVWFWNKIFFWILVRFVILYDFKFWGYNFKKREKIDRENPKVFYNLKS